MSKPSDRLLVRTAIRHGWDVPQATRDAVVDAAAAELREAGDAYGEGESGRFRDLLGCARLFIAAERDDIRDRLAESKVLRREGRRERERKRKRRWRAARRGASATV